MVRTRDVVLVPVDVLIEDFFLVDPVIRVGQRLVANFR